MVASTAKASATNPCGHVATYVAVSVITLATELPSLPAAHHSWHARMQLQSVCQYAQDALQRDPLLMAQLQQQQPQLDELQLLPTAANSTADAAEALAPLALRLQLQLRGMYNAWRAATDARAESELAVHQLGDELRTAREARHEAGTAQGRATELADRLSVQLAESKVRDTLRDRYRH